MNFIGKILLFAVLALPLGCAYHFGYGQRTLPGGYQKVAIPVFKNMTQEVGVETYFTNAMIRQFTRSQVAQVASMNDAPVDLIGRIKSVITDRGGLAEAKNPVSSENPNNLPQNSVQAREYRIFVTVELELRRISDQKVLWQGSFKDERGYTAPQVGKEVVNSVDPLYNASARKEVIEQLSYDMMANAHDRITENF